MKYLVTGSSGHLGEALVRVLRDNGEDVSSIDIIDGAFTSHTGSIVDRDFVRERMKGVDAVLPRRHASQAPCRHPRAAGLRGRQHLRNPQPP